MLEAATVEKGIVYVGFADAVAWVSSLPKDALEDFIERMGEKPRHDYGLENQAVRIVRDEFSDRTLSWRIVRTGEPTLYDRDDRALPIIESMLAYMEQITGGYAFEQHPDETQLAVWTAMDIARSCAAAHSAEDLHAYARALDEGNDFDFQNPSDYRVVGAFSEALAASGIADRTDLRLRYLGWKDGFISEDAYAELVRTEGPMRRAVSTAASDFYHRFGDACGRFDFDKARERFLSTGNARYFDAPYSPKTWEENVATLDAHQKRAEETVRVQAFNRREREQGFSPYGYWFAPDGTVHSMKDWQIHETWIRGTLDNGPGIRTGRFGAFADGWVSMTMMNEKNPGANIAYGDGSPCQKALKAAARVVRRGGEFSAVIIEAYDGLESVGYEFHDDIKAGFRRLNELSNGIGSALKP